MYTQLGNRMFASLTAMMIIAAVSFLPGCADRDDRPDPEDADPAAQQAADALNQAQEAMVRAGIEINFSDIGTLGDLATVLPDPVELGILEDQGAIQEAIGAMYGVLDAFGQRGAIAQAPANPAQDEPEISDSDYALVHIHLAYLYVLEAVRVLTVAGWGADGIPDTADNLYRISYPDNPNFGNVDEVYTFELTPLGQAKFDAIAVNPTAGPADYLREFSTSQRQAVLDALALLLGASVKTLAFPDITDSDGLLLLEQRPQIDSDICREDALFHLEKAFDTAKEIAPDLADAMEEFIKIIAEVFAEDLLNQTAEWGFEVENEQEILNRISAFTTE